MQQTGVTLKPWSWCRRGPQNLVGDKKIAAGAKKIAHVDKLRDGLADFLRAAERGNAFGFADDQPTVGEGDDIDFGRLLTGSAEVELGDVLEGPGGCCQRSAG